MNVLTALSNLGIKPSEFEKMREMAGVESVSSTINATSEDIKEEITLTNQESAFYTDDENEVNLHVLSPFQQQMEDELQRENRYLIEA